MSAHVYPSTSAALESVLDLIRAGEPITNHAVFKSYLDGIDNAHPTPTPLSQMAYPLLVDRNGKIPPVGTLRCVATASAFCTTFVSKMSFAPGNTINNNDEADTTAERRIYDFGDNLIRPATVAETASFMSNTYDTCVSQLFKFWRDSGRAGWIGSTSYLDHHVWNPVVVDFIGDPYSFPNNNNNTNSDGADNSSVEVPLVSLADRARSGWPTIVLPDDAVVERARYSIAIRELDEALFFRLRRSVRHGTTAMVSQDDAARERYRDANRSLIADFVNVRVWMLENERRNVEAATIENS